MTDEHEIDYLDLDDLVALATALLGEPAPIRDLGLLGSAVARTDDAGLDQIAIALRKLSE